MRITRTKEYDANIVGNRLTIVERATGAELISVDVPDSMDFVYALSQVVECLKTALDRNIEYKATIGSGDKKSEEVKATAKKKTTTKKTAKKDEEDN